MASASNYSQRALFALCSAIVLFGGLHIANLYNELIVKTTYTGIANLTDIEWVHEGWGTCTKDSVMGAGNTCTISITFTPIASYSCYGSAR